MTTVRNVLIFFCVAFLAGLYYCAKRACFLPYGSGWGDFAMLNLFFALLAGAGAVFVELRNSG